MVEYDVVTLQTETEFFQTNHQVVVNKSLANLIAGSTAGSIGKLVEHPFDTIKVRLQCQELGKSIGPFECFKSILREDGPKGFFRGLSTPTFGAVLENAVLFVTYGKIQNMMKTVSNSESLSLGHLGLAGAISGMAVSLVLTPVELIKCKMQMNPNYKGPIDCIIKTIRSTGLSGIYKGHGATFARESMGGAAWFGTYELACKILCSPSFSFDGKEKKKEDLGPLPLMAAGSLSGIGYHSILFPADVIKSQVQALSGSQKPEYFTRLKNLYMSEGLKGLYRGFGVTLCRAVPANAIIFVSYEFVYQSLT